VINNRSATIEAARDMTLTDATQQRDEMHLHQEKKSGFSGTGGVGFSYGRNALKTTDDGTTLSSAGSTVGSTGGSVSLTAGNGLTVRGSEVLAGKNLALTGREVNILAAENQSKQTHTMEQKTSGLAGAAGAVTGEYLARQLYPDTPRDRLSEEQKQTLSALSTLAAGLAGGLAGDSTADAIAGGQTGKNAAENNNLAQVLAAAEANKKGTIEKWQADKQAEIEKACNSGTPVSCQMAVAAMGTIISPWILPEAVAISGAIGAGAVGAIDYGLTGSVDPKNVIGAYWTGALTRYAGFKSTVAINAAGGAITSYIDGKNPFLYGTISGVGGAIGYGIGNKIITPIADDIFNPTWKTLRWDDIGMGISRPSTLNPIPAITGTAGGGLAGETFNVLTDPNASLENEKEIRNDK
jgi:hypothetical protein